MSWCCECVFVDYGFTGSVKLGRLRRRVELSRIRNGRKRETNPRTQSKQGTELLLLEYDHSFGTHYIFLFLIEYDHSIGHTFLWCYRPYVVMTHVVYGLRLKDLQHS